MAKQGKVGPVEVFFRQHTAGEGWGVGVDHGEVAGRGGGGRERTIMRESGKEQTPCPLSLWTPVSHFPSPSFCED